MATRTPESQKIRRFARAIARDLFTMRGYKPERAQRLVLTIDTPEKRNLGGWCERAVVDRIEDHLARAAKRRKTP